MKRREHIKGVTKMNVCDYTKRKLVDNITIKTKKEVDKRWNDIEEQNNRPKICVREHMVEEYVEWQFCRFYQLWKSL